MDYCAPRLPGLSQSLSQTLEVAQNNVLRTILDASRWTSIDTLGAECGLPSIKYRIFAKAFLRIRSWPNTLLNNHLLHGSQRQPNTTYNGDWIHAVANAARDLEVSDAVRCEPDLRIPDYIPPPPWAPKTFTIHLSPHTRLKSRLSTLLRQESVAAIASFFSADALHYFTEGSAKEDGTAGAAFVCGAITRSFRLSNNTTAFQAELIALLISLQCACNLQPTSIHISDSLSALHAIQHDSPTDNVLISILYPFFIHSLSIET